MSKQHLAKMGFLRDNYLSEERRVKSEKSKCQVADYTHEAFDFNYFNYYNYFNSK